MPCWAAALRPPSPGRCLVPRRRQGEPAAGAGGRPGAAQPESRQRARPQEAFHPEAREQVPHRVVRAAVSRRRRGPAWPWEQARHRAPATVIPPPGVRQDVRQGAVHRGGRWAACQACCPEPALQLAQALLSELALLLSEPALRWGQQASPGALRGPQVPERVLPWAPAVPQDPLPEAAEAWARAVAEPRRAAVPAVWEPGVPRAVPEGEESARAAAALQPAAVTAASGRQAAVEAAAEPDGPQAAVGAGAEPDGPQVAAEAVGALLGAAVLQPAEAQRADGAEQPRAAVGPGARAPQAAQPSEAASVFRQGRSLVSALARPRATARFAHAMRCLPIASRSEPWSQAAGNEGWSWWSTSPEGSLTK